MFCFVFWFFFNPLEPIWHWNKENIIKCIYIKSFEQKNKQTSVIFKKKTWHDNREEFMNKYSLHSISYMQSCTAESLHSITHVIVFEGSVIKMNI